MSSRGSFGPPRPGLRLQPHRHAVRQHREEEISDRTAGHPASNDLQRLIPPATGTFSPSKISVRNERIAVQLRASAVSLYATPGVRPVSPSWVNPCSAPP